MFDIATESFLFDLYYGGKSASEALEDGDETPTENIVYKVDETTPVFRNIYVKNLTSRNARRAMYFNGLPEMNITNINLENTTITSTFGGELSESDGITFKNVKIIPKKGPALILNNIKNMDATGLRYPDSLNEVVKITGNLNEKINLPKTLKEDKIIK